MLKEHEVNRLNNFIMGWYADDTTFCDELIELHRKSDSKQINGAGVDVKESTDVPLSLNQPSSYWETFVRCWGLYFNKYPAAKMNCGMTMKQFAVIQHYPIGGGYKVWHHERGDSKQPYVSRHLVFMTYLNDVPDGGTEFIHQNLKIKAERGLTLIWPADWMFTHKGEISFNLEKWIITGWINLKDENENSNLFGRPS